MHNQLNVPEDYGEIETLFFCNFRMNEKFAGFVEDFHVRCIGGHEENINFDYTNPLELEYGFTITTNGVVQLFCNKWNDNNLKCHPNYYLLGSGHGGKVKDAYKAAYKILEQTDSMELAFVFSTGVFEGFPCGVVLYQNSNLIPFNGALEKVKADEKEYCCGKAYLAILKNDRSIVIHNISTGLDNFYPTT